MLESGAGNGDATAFRIRHGIPSDVPLLCVLPGSRRSESSRLLPIFADTVAQLVREYPELRVVVPTVETVVEDVARAVASWPVPVTVVRGTKERYDAFAACRAALAASGTVALELALARLPMVITYRVTAITAYLVRRLIKIRYVCLLNLLLDRLVVPELIQDDCEATKLTTAILPLLRDGQARDDQLAGLAEALEKLSAGADHPSLRAAHEVLSHIGLMPSMPS